MALDDPYRLPARVSFSQVFFSPDRRGRAAEADASLVLAGLRTGTLPAAAAYTSPIWYTPGE